VSSSWYLTQWSSSPGLFCHVPFKRIHWDYDWRLRLNYTPNAKGCTCSMCKRIQRNLWIIRIAFAHLRVCFARSARTYKHRLKDCTSRRVLLVATLQHNATHCNTLQPTESWHALVVVCRCVIETPNSKQVTEICPTIDSSPFPDTTCWTSLNSHGYLDFKQYSFAIKIKNGPK